MSNSYLVESLQYCLKPLVQLCLRYDIDHQSLSDMLKATFVSVAEKEISSHEAQATDSKISLMTGLNNEEVKQLRHPSKGDVPAPGNRLLPAKLISHWIGTPKLLDEWGHPRPLQYLSIGDGVSFEELVHTIAEDVDPRELLDECIRKGIVRTGPDDVVHLKVNVLIPESDVAQKATFFSHALHDHMAAASHNLMGKSPSFLERYVWHTNMTEAAAAHLAVMAEMAAMDALKAINQQAIEYEATSAETHDNTPRNVRIHFGTYFYSTVQE